MKNIYLWGLPGVGKTTFGKVLADKLSFNFVDLDRAIENHLMKSIMEVFNQEGEEYFREIETNILKETLFCDNTVVACGGGTPCFFNNADWMNWNGITVLLERSIQDIAKDIRQKSLDRPLIKERNIADISEKLIKLQGLRGVYFNRSSLLHSINQHSMDSLLLDIEAFSKKTS